MIALPKKLYNCLECYKEQIVESEFTPELSYLVDAIDLILEEGQRNGQKNNSEQD